MHLDPLLEIRADAVHGGSPRCPVMLTTRIRLARNLARQAFPGWARESQKRDVLKVCLPAVASLPVMKRGVVAALDELSEVEKLILFERHLISRDLIQSKTGAGVVVSRDQTASVMVNEEDHLRIQVLRTGDQLKRIWTTVSGIDAALDEALDFAFDPELGFLTACPSNVGTGLRASAMMHLPGLVMGGLMDKVIHAVNQMGIVVRGLFGEGSDASGSIFQISNQMTLGESEEEILKRLGVVFAQIVKQELNAREVQLERERHRLLDRIGRAFGILQNCHVLNSNEAINHLSLVRLAVDLGFLPEDVRALVDRLLIECQPGHIQHAAHGNADAAQRDVLRASLLRREFERIVRPDFTSPTPN